VYVGDSQGRQALVELMSYDLHKQRLVSRRTGNYEACKERLRYLDINGRESLLHRRNSALRLEGMSYASKS
jgi:hypothetical protein